MVVIQSDMIILSAIKSLTLFFFFQLQGQTNAEGSAILVLDHTAGELYNKVHKVN